MRSLPLTKGLVATVDDEDFPALADRKWTAHVAKGKAYAVRKDTVRGRLWMHREIMRAQPGVEVDHVDGNGLNNQRSNLRLCSRSQNSRAMRPRAGHRFKGAYYNRQRRKWVAQIQFIEAGERTNHYLGTFDSEEAAARAYDAAALQHFGEFARLNFPAMEHVR